MPRCCETADCTRTSTERSSRTRPTSAVKIQLRSSPSRSTRWHEHGWHEDAAGMSAPMSSVVRVAKLRKTFNVPVREAGLRAALGSFVNRKTRDVRAVDDITFSIEPGEVVGFLGPNGAGKTTTLKML